MQHKPSGPSIFSRFAKTYLILFGSTVVAVLLVFSLLQAHILRTEQTTEASVYLAELAGVIEDSTVSELDQRVPIFLQTLSGQQLFKCLRVAVPGLGREYAWPSPGCGPSGAPALQRFDIPIDSDARGLRLETAYALDEDRLSFRFAAELGTLIGATVLIGLLSLWSLTLSFKRTVTSPLAALRKGFRTIGSVARAPEPSSVPETSEFIELIEAHRQLAERESRLARANAYRLAITDQAFDCIVSIDSRGNIVDFNPAAEETFALARDDVLGRPLVDTIIPPKHRDAHLGGFKRHLETGQTHVLGKRIEIDALRGDGSEFPVELSVTAFEVVGEKYFTAYIRDITSDLEREKALVSAKELAEESSRAKSQFLSTVSHEIRSPLNAVLASIEILEGMNLEPEQRRFVDIASKSGATLLSFIEDILDMSRIESGQLVLTRAPLSLGDVAAEVVDLFSASARDKRLSLHSASAEGLPAFVLGDRTRIRQVLINLVANAIKFTNAGSVTIDVERLGKQDVYRLSVADTGIGIATTEAQRVFEPFVQLDSGFSRRQEGTGLGLAISKRLVEAMGGSIGYESTPGGGSRFWFELELATARGPDKTAPMILSAGKTRTGDGKDSTAPYRVLVAEDSPANRAVLCAYLQADGLEVDTAQNGQEVLDTVAESDYDIILMDVSMPGMDGLEAARRLRSLPGTARSIPIVALTAHAFEHAREQCLAAGMDAFVTKPVSKSALLNTLAQQLQNRPDRATG